MLITCAICDKKLKVADSVAGKKVRCPQCKALVLAPKPAEDDIAEAIEAPKPKAKPVHTVSKKKTPAQTDITEEEPPPPKKKLPAKKPRDDRDDEDDDAPADAMRCAKCESARIEALPPNRFSRNPGFVCKKCGAHMRPPNSTGFYLFAILLGIFGVLAGLSLLGFGVIADGFPMRAIGGGIIIAIASGSVIGWAFKQTMLPVPLNAPPFAWVRWIVITLLVLFVGAIAVGGCLFGFAYFLHEMM